MTKKVRKLFTILALAFFSVSIMGYAMLSGFLGSSAGPTAMAASFDMEYDVEPGQVEDPCFIPLCMGAVAVIMLLAVLVLKKLE